MMDIWVERYRTEAEHIVKSGNVRALEFSGSTYQVEVYDPEAKESFWPFLQFDEQEKLKDAFCSCVEKEEKCLHLAAAYLKILGPERQPLHIRFENSFWNHLCLQFGDHCGYEERFLQKKGEGSYFYEDGGKFEIEGKTSSAKRRLQQMIEERPRETPENSIKFSNLSQEEVHNWRAGRPSPQLRYRLSFWSDLAKWMMSLSSTEKIIFEEDIEGFPTRFWIHFAPFSVYFEINKRDLTLLIPYMGSIKAPLKVFQLSESKVKKITFNPLEPAFHIEHTPLPEEEKIQNALPLGEWSYVPKVGFFLREGHSLLSHSTIEREEIPQFLEQFHDQIAHYIPVFERRLSLTYSMHFDAEWNWHFEVYLFERGDLQRLGSLFLGKWVYLSGEGFYPIKDPLFESVEVFLPASQVSNFVNLHRVWLNEQEGFQTHLANIESHLNYEVTEKGSLRFRTSAQTERADAKDFGDWIYYGGQGFFSKKNVRLGWVVRPGLEVRAAEISTFIKANRDELESVPEFFTTLLPLASRGLEVSVLSPSSLYVKPVYRLAPAFAEARVHIFGEFVYLQDEGFCELPPSMRLPDHYSKPVTLSHSTLHHFLENELPLLAKYFEKYPVSLKIPHKTDLVLHSADRTGEGRVRTQLFYQTEWGEVAVTDLLEAFENKRRYCFSPAGLIDLHGEAYQWMRHYKNQYDFEKKVIELSTLELIRLDATLGLLVPPEQSSNSTCNLLKELREFTAHEIPNLRGLKSELRSYQQNGVHWLWFLYKNGLSGLLCDDMGLGKTHQAMALIAATLNQKGGPKRYLVVCPTSVIYHWQDKLETFLPHLKIHTFHGLKRSLEGLPSEGLLLTSYGILRKQQKEIGEIPFEVAIFDEIQIAKNPRSRIHDALKKIKSEMRVGLTGTPIENSLSELKSLFDIVLPGYMPGETRYRELFINPIERDLNEEKKALLSQLIRPFILRRKKTEVLQELPEKSEDKSYCDLSEEQAELYRETLLLSKEALIANLNDQSMPVNYIHVFSLLSRLKQICDHPALIHKDPKNFQRYSSGKWDLFVELLQEARESEQKVVVFSQYLYMLDVIENYLQEKGWIYAQIRGDTVNRREELKRFQEDPNCVVFIGSLQAAGLGIDLTAASVVIMYDRWWNAARENQAIDRVHRIGQKWGVQVYKLITKNTIEEKIDQMITRKGRLLEEIIASDDQALLKKFTRSELIELLSFQ